MIDPFPEAPRLPDDGKPGGRSAQRRIRALFSVLRAQTQFKPSEVAAVGDTYSRFMVAPHRSRTVNGTEVEDHYAIASGLLGGFGGFFDRSFRDHDFQLGRRNCQKFLRDTFCLPAGTPGQLGHQAAGSYATLRLPPQSNEAALRYPLIPLVGDARHRGATLPAWPRITQAEFDRIAAGRIAARLARWSPN